MVKIEVTVVDAKDDNCTITVKTPKYYKKSSDNEKKIANVVGNEINNTLTKLSKGAIWQTN